MGPVSFPCQLAHTCLKCTKLQTLHCLLKNILLRFWVHYSPHIFIYALPIHGLKSWDPLVNCLLALAKLAIYPTRKEALAGGLPVIVKLSSSQSGTQGWCRATLWHACQKWLAPTHLEEAPEAV